MALDTPKRDFKIVGTRVPRPDGIDKVTGKAAYGADITATGMLHGRILRSPHAHARIISIDTSAAEAAEGVKAIVTSADFANPDDAGMRDIRDNCLALDKVLYDGHAVVAVAATPKLQRPILPLRHPHRSRRRRRVTGRPARDVAHGEHARRGRVRLSSSDCAARRRVPRHDDAVGVAVGGAVVDGPANDEDVSFAAWIGSYVVNGDCLGELEVLPAPAEVAAELDLVRGAQRGHLSDDDEPAVVAKLVDVRSLDDLLPGDARVAGEVGVHGGGIEG